MVASQHSSEAPDPSFNPFRCPEGKMTTENGQQEYRSEPNLSHTADSDQESKVRERRITAYERLSHDLSNDKRCLKEITLGKRIGFYRIRGELGSGNFSQVKLGIHALTKGRFSIIYLFEHSLIVLLELVNMASKEKDGIPFSMEFCLPIQPGMSCFLPFILIIAYNSCVDSVQGWGRGAGIFLKCSFEFILCIISLHSMSSKILPGLIEVIRIIS